MTTERLQIILEQTGYRVAENAFQEAQRLPYIAFLEEKGNTIFADNSVWVTAVEWRVELYRAPRDRAARLRLERALCDAQICWERESTYLPEERCTMDVYDFTELEG